MTAVMSKLGFTAMAVFGGFTVSTLHAVVYVNVVAEPGGDGSNWQHALLSIQQGLDSADLLDEQVWVAQGEYQERIWLKNGVALYGGFAGTESSLAERNAALNVTIINGQQTGSTVTGADQAIIDGFTITGGDAGAGGGIFNEAVSPTISNNIICGNIAGSGGGGGIYSYLGHPWIHNNVVCDNVAQGLGGGIYNDNTTSALVIERNIITGNCLVFTAGHGGGIMNTNAPTRIRNNIIFNNTAGYGGGVYNLMSSPTIEHNTIVGNSATYGGGIWSSSGSSPTITNNIVSTNSNYGVYSIDGNDFIAYNDLWNNSPANVFGLIPSLRDFSADPMFVDATAGNYHLQTESPCVNAGDPIFTPVSGETDIDGDVRLQCCRTDVGADETTSFNDCNSNGIADACEPDADGDTVTDDCDICPGFDDRDDEDADGIPDDCDICAATIPGLSVDENGCPPFVPGDFDSDGDVDADDFGNWQACGSGPFIEFTSGCEDKDCDNDGDVDQADFGLFQRCLSGTNIPADPHCND